jgi:Ion transport protein
LAFPEVQTFSLYVLDIVMNLVFAIDILLNFISPYYDTDYTIIDDPKVPKHLSHSL